MGDLIKALMIFQKYQDLEYPTVCAHDELYIVAVTYDEVSKADRHELKSLGFFWDPNARSWMSTKYGSA